MRTATIVDMEPGAVVRWTKLNYTATRTIVGFDDGSEEADGCKDGVGRYVMSDGEGNFTGWIPASLVEDGKVDLVRPAEEDS